MFSPVDYKKFDQLTLADLDLLAQAYYRLIAEGYSGGFSFSDFLDIVTGRGEHEFNEFREMQVIEDLQPKKIFVRTED